MPVRWLASVVLCALISCGPAEPQAGDSTAGAEQVEAPTARDGRVALLVLGDSLTAGFGVAQEEAWPALLQARLDAAGIPVRVINAGISGDTTSGGAARLAWYRREPVALIVVALGGNDGLRGIAPAVVKANLHTTVARARELWPGAGILLAGMQAPPSMGDGFTREFAAVWSEVALAEDLPLVPFLLDGVGGEPARNLPDGIHPNAAGHAIIERTVWLGVEPLLRARVRDPAPAAGEG